MSPRCRKCNYALCWCDSIEENRYRPVLVQGEKTPTIPAADRHTFREIPGWMQSQIAEKILELNRKAGATHMRLTPNPDRVRIMLQEPRPAHVWPIDFALEPKFVRMITAELAWSRAGWGFVTVTR